MSTQGLGFRVYGAFVFLVCGFAIWFMAVDLGSSANKKNYEKLLGSMDGKMT